MLAGAFAQVADATRDIGLQCALHLVRIATFRGRHDEAEQLAGRAGELVGDDRTSPGYALLLMEHCTSALGRSDYGAVAQRAGELLEAAEATGDLRSRAIAFYYTGVGGGVALRRHPRARRAGRGGTALRPSRRQGVHGPHADRARQLGGEGAAGSAKRSRRTARSSGWPARSTTRS